MSTREAAKAKAAQNEMSPEQLRQNLEKNGKVVFTAKGEDRTNFRPFLEEKLDACGFKMPKGLESLNGKEVDSAVITKDINGSYSFSINWKRPPTKSNDLVLEKKGAVEEPPAQETGKPAEDNQFTKQYEKNADSARARYDLYYQNVKGMQGLITELEVTDGVKAVSDDVFKVNDVYQSKKYGVTEININTTPGSNDFMPDLINLETKDDGKKVLFVRNLGADAKQDREDIRRYYEIAGELKGNDKFWKDFSENINKSQPFFQKIFGMKPVLTAEQKKIKEEMTEKEEKLMAEARSIIQRSGKDALALYNLKESAKSNENLGEDVQAYSEKMQKQGYDIVYYESEKEIAEYLGRQKDGSISHVEFLAHGMTQSDNSGARKGGVIDTRMPSQKKFVESLQKYATKFTGNAVCNARQCWSGLRGEEISAAGAIAYMWNITVVGARAPQVASAIAGQTFGGPMGPAALPKGYHGLEYSTGEAITRESKEVYITPEQDIGEGVDYPLYCVAVPNKKLNEKIIKMAPLNLPK
jgi:hypothetical protein